MDHILVVDDDELVKSLVKEALERFGYKVTAACNGKEGFDYFNNSPCFKLVITDIRMPVMDGIEFARSIRNSDRPDTPIIAISAYFGNTGIERGLFNSIIGKPFNLGSLVKIINSHL